MALSPSASTTAAAPITRPPIRLSPLGFPTFWSSIRVPAPSADSVTH